MTGAEVAAYSAPETFPTLANIGDVISQSFHGKVGSEACTVCSSLSQRAPVQALSVSVSSDSLLAQAFSSRQQRSHDFVATLDKVSYILLLCVQDVVLIQVCALCGRLDLARGLCMCHWQIFAQPCSRIPGGLKLVLFHRPWLTGSRDVQAAEGAEVFVRWSTYSRSGGTGVGRQRHGSPVSGRDVFAMFT